jgi:23S rRNA pseudouridine2605 synthase
MKERLQKLIAAAGLASRREAERWIIAGRVTVNGVTAALGDSADPSDDRIAVDSRPLLMVEQKYYVLLNKPSGYVTTMNDPEGRPVVTDLVKDIPTSIHPDGRLDLTTEGLLLLTNDGELTQRLAHPRHEVEKVYLVRVRGALSIVARRQLEEGVLLDDGLTAPARVEKVRASGSHTWLEITIREGRNRQVRRMCEAVGLPVSRLKRIRLAFLELGSLPAGKYRSLTSAEVARLKKL